jgi:hypothetical protein
MKQKFDFPKQTAGDTFRAVTMTLNINGSPEDLTLYTIKMELRKDNHEGEVVHTASIGSGMTVGNPLTGQFRIDEFELPSQGGTYVYDIEFTNGSGIKRTYVYGTLRLDEDITT